MDFLGKFIAIEGIDGAGTTTQARLLSEWMEKNGYKVYFTKEPTGFLIGQVIRLALRREVKYDNRVIALLFAADRLHHTEKVILPRLREGVHVVSDRYVMSSIAYQGALIDIDWVRIINRYALAPTVTLYIDVPVRIAIERMKAKGRRREIYEIPELLERVRKIYIEECKRNEGKCVIVDGSQPINVVHSNIIRIVQPILK